MQLADADAALVRAALLGDLEAWRRWLLEADPAACRTAERALLPMVHHNLGRHHVAVPHADTLARVHREVWFQTSLVLHDTLEALDALEQIGVRPVLIKGAAVLSDAYLGDVGLRPISDVDATVDGTRREAAMAALADQGWENRSRDAGLTTWHAVNLERGARGALDLHWQMLLLGRDDKGDLDIRQRAVTTRLVDRQVSVVPPEAMVLIGAAHAAPNELKWTIDVAAALAAAGDSFDWDWLSEAARRRLMLRRVLVTLESLAAAVPELLADTALEPLRARRPSPLERVVPTPTSSRLRATAGLVLLRSHRAPWRERIVIPALLVGRRAKWALQKLPGWRRRRRSTGSAE